MFLCWLLRRCWLSVLLERGLLDEEDVGLLAAVTFDDGEEDNAAEPGGNNYLKLRWEILVLALATSSAVFHPPAFVAFMAVAILMLFFLAFGTFFFLLPRIIGFLWTNCVDSNFQRFVGELRQREAALFSLRHLNASSDLTVPLRQSRLHCLRRLCQFVRQFNGASLQMVSSSEEGANLLFNFVGDEMQALCPLPLTEAEGEQPPQQQIGDDDSDLHLAALKSLWQYHFLVRSEFIRVALFAFLRDFEYNSLSSFCTHLLLLLRTVWTTRWLHLETKIMSSTNLMSTSIVIAGSKSRLAHCRFKLEWALERLNSLDDTNGDHWPPPGSEQCLSSVVKCLEQIAQSLQQTKSTVTGLEENGHLKTEAVIGWTEAFLGEQHKQQINESDGKEAEEEEDYQIFELDLASSFTSMAEKEDDEREISKTDEFDEVDSGHGAVMRELGAALERRKEFCLRRELQALARTRGVQSDDGSRELARELDRVPFADGRRMGEAGRKKSQKMDDEKPPPPPALSRGPFGLSTTAAGLSAATIMEQRTAILRGQEQKTEEIVGDYDSDNGG